MSYRWMAVAMVWVASAAQGQVTITVTPEMAVKQAQQLAATGHTPQAMLLYRVVLRADTENTAAYQQLEQLAASTPMADPTGDMDALAKLFPDGTHMRKTAHFLVVYNTSDAFADSRAKLLEQAYESFYKKMKAAGLRPLPIPHRLVAIIFDRFEDYLSYAKTTQKMDASEAAGYYSTLTNRIAMYNSQSNPQFKKMADQVARLDAEVSELNGRIDAASRAGDQAQATRLRTARNIAVSQLSETRNQFQRIAGLNNIAQTFHEASHQLAYNSDVQWMGATYPFWYSEGLATNFETVNPAVPFGPGEPNYPRQYALRQVSRRSKLLPLTQLATTVELAAGVERGDWYGQAWGLFHWLYQTKPAELRRYRALLNQRNRHATAETLKEDFESAFGSIATLEPQWQRWVYNLK
jgi:hypothetical protein